MYYNGESVEKDYLLAHMYFSLAAAQNVNNAEKFKTAAAGNLSAESLAQAQKMQAEWIAAHQ